MIKIIFHILFLLLVVAPEIAVSQDFSDYLILQDIGQYKISTPEKLIPGFAPVGGPRLYESSGIIAGSGHFNKDHMDKTFKIMYLGGNGLSSPTVEITQHTGSDSDKWLMHEVERGFRRGDYEENMTPSRFRNIDGNNIFYSGLGGGTYRWKSNTIIVSIEYTDLYRQKSEPLEVVKAYLAKLPSTISAMTIDRSHNEQWLKDEMDRRLWLCDKWDMQFQLGKVSQNDLIRELVDHMSVFLDYREKYYGIKAYDEKVGLLNYKSQSDLTSIKNKLTEYKNWWSTNKGNPINL
jgi:hypothetical protein